MKTDRSQLWEEYEDAAFAILMHTVAEQEGEQALQCLDELQQDPSAQLPEEAKQRAEQTVRKTFAAKSRRSARQRGFRILRRVAVAVVVVVLMTVCVFVAFPEVRVGILNTLITPLNVGGNKSSGFLLDIEWIPEGFVLTDEGEDQLSTWQRYTDQYDEQKTLYVSEDALTGQSIAVDTEDADMENIMIQGHEAILITKEAWTCILCTVPEQSMVLHLQSEFIPVSDIIKVAENVQLNKGAADLT